AEQRRFGTWWMAPFARAAGMDLLGFRLLPRTRLTACPIVWASGPATVTLATQVERLVPVIIFAQMLATPRRWTDAAELLDNEWEELIAAHRLFGGRDDLSAVRQIAADAALQRACAQPGIARDLAAADILERLDASPHNTTFRDAVRAQTQRQPAGERRDAGCWSAALDALAFDPDENGAEGASSSLEGLASAWRLFQHPAGLDVAWSAPTSPWPAPVTTRAAGLLYRAAQRLVANQHAAPEIWRSDPLWPAIAALAAAPGPFDFHGVPFLEAAASLDAQGQPERALDAITAVEFWNSFTEAEPMDEALEAAHALAQRQRWAHLAAITEAVHQEAIAPP
ncbi:MAG: hypothetical protein HC863_01185, partial [Myxococcales bacterium]|nr:hypothetical protein [Myxococcales bacterium]